MKDIIIVVLIFACAALLHMVNQDRRERTATTLIPSVKVIDWPEELAPTLQAYKKVSHKMSFELVGDTLIV